MEQNQYISQEWRPPSPTSATPQSAKMGAYTFQSPMTSRQSPTHFQNAWMTPQGKGYEAYAEMSSPWPMNFSPNMNGSNFGSAQNVNQPDTTQGFSERQIQTSLPKFTNSHASAPLLAAPQPEPLLNHPQHQSYGAVPMPLADSSPIQMRTPPPTRDSTAKRRPKATLQTLQTPSTTAARRLSTPSTSWLRRSLEFPTFDTSNSPLNPVQYSPSDSMQFSFGGPATAPVYQPSNLFWDPANNGGFDDSNLSNAIEDPFISVPASSVTMVVPSNATADSNITTQQQTTFHKPLPRKSEITGPQSTLSSQTSPNVAKTRPHSMSLVSSATSVNPSLLVTAQDLELQPSTQLTSSLNVPIENRQPYELQMEQARREKERSRRYSSQQSRPATAVSDVDGFDMRNTLRRSMTDSRMKRSSMYSHVPSHASSSGIHDITQGLRNAHIPRTASPLKRHKSDAYKGMSNSRQAARRSIILTVDEDGRASTNFSQNEPVVNDHLHEQLSTLAPTECNLSGRSSPDPDLFPSSQGSSSTASQMDAGSKASRRAARNLMADLASHLAPRNPPGDAQVALREVMRDRQNQRRGKDQSVSQYNANLTVPTASQTNQSAIRPDNMPSQTRQSQSQRSRPPPDTAPFAHPQDSDLWNDTFNTSSHLPDPHSSVFGSHGQPGNGVRCVCQDNFNDDQLMVQCDSCTNWLHVDCVGLSNGLIPPAYVCVFCTGNLSSVRGGQIRDPLRTRPVLSSSFSR